MRVIDAECEFAALQRDRGQSRPWLVAVVIGVIDQRYDSAAAAAVTLLFLPLGVLSVASWIGLWLPYHPRALLWRWEHRSDGRATLLRWSVLLILPYIFVPIIGLVLLTPSLIIWILAHRGYPPHQIDPVGLSIGTAVACMVSLIVFAWAPTVASKIARRRYDRLHGYLSNPEQG